MNCSACGRRGLRTTTTVYMPGKDGELARRRVCVACAKKSFAILPAERGTRCTCGALAVTCGACVDKTADKAKRGAADAHVIAGALRKRAKAYEKKPHPNNPGSFDDGETEWNDGLRFGLEMAADFVEGGNW